MGVCERVTVCVRVRECVCTRTCVRASMCDCRESKLFSSCLVFVGVHEILYTNARLPRCACARVCAWFVSSRSGLSLCVRVLLCVWYSLFLHKSREPIQLHECLIFTVEAWS